MDENNTSEQDGVTKVRPENVQDFLKEIANKNGGNSQPGQTPDDAPKRVTIPADKVFKNGENKLNVAMKTSSYTEIEKKVKVTDPEKEDYLKSVLFDTAFETTIQLYGGKVLMTLRSRSKAVTDAIFDFLKRRAETDGAKTADFIQNLQLAYLVTSLRAMGSGKSMEPFAGRIEDIENFEKLPRDRMVEELEKACDELRRVSMPGPKWQTIVNGFNVFARKEQLLGEMIVNEDF